MRLISCLLLSSFFASNVFSQVQEKQDYQKTLSIWSGVSPSSRNGIGGYFSIRYELLSFSIGCDRIGDATPSIIETVDAPNVDGLNIDVKDVVNYNTSIDIDMSISTPVFFNFFRAYLGVGSRINDIATFYKKYRIQGTDYYFKDRLKSQKDFPQLGFLCGMQLSVYGNNPYNSFFIDIQWHNIRKIGAGLGYSFTL